jgi:maltose alpha-D-glucosyltransferase/alpha-amylase
VRVGDRATIRDEPVPVYLTVLEVTFAEGRAELYLLPLTIAAGAEARRLRAESPRLIVAETAGPAGAGVLCDATGDDGTCAALLAAIEEQREIPTLAGVIRGAPTAFYDELRGPRDVPLPISRGSAEQSNTNIHFGDRLLLKVFRRLEAGPNPDFEVTRFLTERTTFRRTPLLAGGLEYQRHDLEATPLAMLQQLVRAAGDGWEYTLQALRRYYEHAVQPADTARPNLAAFGPGRELPPAIRAAIGDSADTPERLGRVTAELHLALASDPNDPAFKPEPLTDADLSILLTDMQDHAEKVFAWLAGHLDALPDRLRGQAQGLLAERDRIMKRLTVAPALDGAALKIRCHGDYHLGQVLRVPDGYMILDFEGEPIRPLSQRRAKQSPLKDVAGMIRSFSYAAYAGLFAFTKDQPEAYERLEPWALIWQTWAAASFLGAYRAAAGDAPFLPADPLRFESLLQLFLLDKVFYELHYELNNRPDWVGIPLQGVMALLRERE